MIRAAILATLVACPAMADEVPQRFEWDGSAITLVANGEGGVVAYENELSFPLSFGGPMVGALEVDAKAMELAEVWGMRDEGTNPTRHVRAFGEQHRQRTLTDDEAARLWAVLDAYAARQEVPAVEAIRLILLTGRRKSEWLRARWSDLNLQRGTLELADTKTGAKVFHLPPEALAILAGLPRSSVFILPGRTGGPIGGLQKIWERLRVKAGLPDLRLHDLRHTVGSLADRAGMSQRQIADLLGHAQLSTTARYINSADDHKRATAAEWAAVVTRITGR